MEQKSSRFLSEMVLAPFLGLTKKSVTMYGGVLCIVMDFFSYPIWRYVKSSCDFKLLEKAVKNIIPLIKISTYTS